MNKTDYNARYMSGYMMDFSDLAETDRVVSVKKSVRTWLGSKTFEKALDYGCGQGRYFPVWNELFPGGELSGAEASEAAIDLAKKQYPEMSERLFLIDESGMKYPFASSFDLILSIEVMEHVENLSSYLRDIFRLLRKGGYFLWTTPCGNALSLEWLRGKLTRGIKPTAEGYRLYSWETASHLRRLKTKEAASILKDIGFTTVRFHHRTHFFGTLAYQLWLRRRNSNGPPSKFLGRLAHLDYRLFRRFPNAASMIGLAQK